jgi:two-component system, cell cycle sensor histidine kinase and response regulator CckA
VGGRNHAELVCILVVDDQFVVRNFVSRVLRQAGYHTETASDGGVAIKVAETFQPLQLLLTDLKMPGMHGTELARAMRARDPGLKVLYLTGHADAAFKEALTLRTGEAFLEKPCTVTGLLEAVSFLLFGHPHGLDVPAG